MTQKAAAYTIEEVVDDTWGMVNYKDLADIFYLFVNSFEEGHRKEIIDLRNDGEITEDDLKRFEQLPKRLGWATVYLGGLSEFIQQQMVDPQVSEPEQEENEGFLSTIIQSIFSSSADNEEEDTAPKDAFKQLGVKNIFYLKFAEENLQNLAEQIKSYNGSETLLREVFAQMHDEYIDDEDIKTDFNIQITDEEEEDLDLWAVVDQNINYDGFESRYKQTWKRDLPRLRQRTDDLEELRWEWVRPLIYMERVYVAIKKFEQNTGITAKQLEKNGFTNNIPERDKYLKFKDAE